MKRGTAKYKGKLPIKYFKCGEVGHFASKFTLKDFERRNKDSRRNKFKKSLYSKEYSCSSKDDESSGSDNEDEILFLAAKKVENSRVVCTNFHVKDE